MVFHVTFLCFSSQEAAWTISNITAGQPHQIQCVVDAGLIPGVIDIMIKVRDLRQFIHTMSWIPIGD